MAGGLAVVTGASRGLGRELALALDREGYRLQICARRSKDLDSVGEQIAAQGREAWSWNGDLTDRDCIEKLMGLLRPAPVEVLINNAAFTPQLKRLEELTASDYNRMFSLSLYVPFRLMQAVIPGMKTRGSGTIVNICSLSGRRAIKNASLYSSSKFALRGLTEAVAQELEGTGVRCFSVSPGGMRTQMRQNLLGDADQQQDPGVVAHIIIEAIAGRIPVPQGADLVVRGGAYTVVARERWTGITMKHEQAAPV